MFFINEKVAMVILIVINIMFIIVGIGSFSHGANKTTVEPSKAKGKIAEGQFSSWWNNGTVDIVGGCVDFLIGVIGLIGAILKLRILKLISGCILCLGILTNICLIIGAPIVGYAALREVSSSLKIAVAENFGHNDTDSKVLTANLVDHQIKLNCCGWSDNAKENVFVSTPWYKSINANGTDKPITLPDSCCIPEAKDECRRTPDIVDARNRKLVHSVDCTEQMLDEAKNAIIAKSVFMVFVMLLQVALVAFIALHLLQKAESAEASSE